MTREQYWHGQVRRTAALLAVWAVVAFGLSIGLAPQLNEVSLAGIPLGFWMAQQGSILVFVALIWVFAWTSDRADRAAGLEEAPETTAPAPPAH